MDLRHLPRTNARHTCTQSISKAAAIAVIDVLAFSAIAVDFSSSPRVRFRGASECWKTLRDGFCWPAVPMKKFAALHMTGYRELSPGVHFSLKQQGRSPNLSHSASLILADIEHAMLMYLVPSSTLVENSLRF